MPRSWSEAVKACDRHPCRVNGRWCSCRVSWRYRMGLPDAVTGLIGRPVWSETFPTKEAADRHQRETRQAIADRSFTAVARSTYSRLGTRLRRRSPLQEDERPGPRVAAPPRLLRHRPGRLLLIMATCDGQGGGTVDGHRPAKVVLQAHAAHLARLEPTRDRVLDVVVLADALAGNPAFGAVRSPPARQHPARLPDTAAATDLAATPDRSRTKSQPLRRTTSSPSRRRDWGAALGTQSGPP